MNNNLKSYLDSIYNIYRHKHSSKDPVWTLHDFHDEKDIEIAGLIISSYSYGRVENINDFVNRFLKKVGLNFYEFTVNFSQQKDKKLLKDLYYRFNSSEDLVLLIKNISSAVKEYGSLKNAFTASYNSQHSSIIPALTEFSEILNKYQNGSTSYGYLIPSPKKRSACKRLNLFLRWMVRKDEIDLGIWSEVTASKLLIPVDTHVYRVSRYLGLADRITPDIKFAEELTGSLKKFDREDPVKYDFALCHVSIDKL